VHDILGVVGARLAGGGAAGGGAAASGAAGCGGEELVSAQRAATRAALGGMRAPSTLADWARAWTRTAVLLFRDVHAWRADATRVPLAHATWRGAVTSLALALSEHATERVEGDSDDEKDNDKNENSSPEAPSARVRQLIGGLEDEEQRRVWAAAVALPLSVQAATLGALKSWVSAMPLCDAPANVNSSWAVVEGARGVLERHAAGNVAAPLTSTFSVCRVFKALVERWRREESWRNETMPLDELRQKAALLLAVDRAARRSGLFGTLREPGEMMLISRGEEKMDIAVMTIQAVGHKGYAGAFSVVEYVHGFPFYGGELCSIETAECYRRRTADVVAAAGEAAQEQVQIKVGSRGRGASAATRGMRLFVTHTARPDVPAGHAVGAEFCATMVKEGLRACGVPTATCHDVRVATTTALMASGVPLEEVRARGMWSSAAMAKKHYVRRVVDLTCEGIPLTPADLAPAHADRVPAAVWKPVLRRWNERGGGGAGAGRMPHSWVLRRDLLEPGEQEEAFQRSR